MDRLQKRAYHKSKRAAWSGDRKAAWKEAWKAKSATWNRKKGQPDAPAPVFVDKKKRSLDKLSKFNYTGTLPERAKVKMEPVVEELPLEPPPKKQRKTRKMAEKLRDSFNERPRNRIRHV